MQLVGAIVGVFALKPVPRQRYERFLKQSP